MNKMKNVALIAMGGAAAFAYQRYKDPLKHAAKKAFRKTSKRANDTLEDMM